MELISSGFIQKTACKCYMEATSQGLGNTLGYCELKIPLWERLIRYGLVQLGIYKESWSDEYRGSLCNNQKEAAATLMIAIIASMLMFGMLGLVTSYISRRARATFYASFFLKEPNRVCNESLPTAKVGGCGPADEMDAACQNTICLSDSNDTDTEEDGSEQYHMTVSSVNELFAIDSDFDSDEEENSKGPLYPTHQDSVGSLDPSLFAALSNFNNILKVDRQCSDSRFATKPRDSIIGHPLRTKNRSSRTQNLCTCCKKPILEPSCACRRCQPGPFNEIDEDLVQSVTEELFHGCEECKLLFLTAQRMR